MVNNAGILGKTFFDDFLTVADYKEVAEVNVWGVIRVTQAMKPLVKKTRSVQPPYEYRDFHFLVRRCSL